jgi:hypothetical protein
MTRRITVTTNDPQHTREQLTYKVNVLVPFTATPRYANFTAIEDGVTPAPMTVDIRKGDGGPLKLEVLSIGESGIEADLRELKPGEHYQLVVSVNPPQKPGRLRSWVRLKTGIEQVPEKTVPVYATIPASWAPTEFAAATPSPVER